MTVQTAAYTTYNRTAVPQAADKLPGWLADELDRVERAVRTPTTKTITAAYTLSVLDDVVLVDCTGGAVTITVPAAFQVMQATWTIKKIDASANAITLSPVLGSTIDGSASVTIARQWATVSLRSNGTAYYTSVYPSIPAPSTVGTLTFGTHLTGGSFNGSANVTIATDATSNNTINTIVARDGSGNFSAGAVSVASLTATGAADTNVITAKASGGGDQVYLLPRAAGNGVQIDSRNAADSAYAPLFIGSSATTFGGGATVSATTFSATTLAGTLSTAAQPNVTSLGTLTGLTVGGTVTAVQVVGTLGALGSVTVKRTTNGHENSLAIDNTNSTGGKRWQIGNTDVTGNAADFSLYNETDNSTAWYVTPTGTFTVARDLAANNVTSFGALAGTLSTASQPNVTSVGTLTGLTVGGDIYAQSSMLIGQINNGRMRFEGTGVNTASGMAGPGIEIWGNNGGSGYVLAFDRTAAARCPLTFDASAVVFTNTATITMPGTLAVTGSASALRAIITPGVNDAITITASAAQQTKLIGVSGSTTASVYQRWTNTGGDMLHGVESSVGGILMTGSSAYATVLSANTGVLELGAGTIGARLDASSTATETRMLLYTVDTGTVQRVKTITNASILTLLGLGAGRLLYVPA